jgi:hypothetical protein
MRLLTHPGNACIDESNDQRNRTAAGLLAIVIVANHFNLGLAQLNHERVKFQIVALMHPEVQ